MYKRIVYVTRVFDEPNLNTNELCTLTEAARTLGVTLQTVDYHIRSGRLSAVISADEELTAYKQPRRWVIREEVERLRVTLLDNSLQGNKWALDERIILTLPEDPSGVVTKSAAGNVILRHITLDAEDTGDLEIDAKAIKDDDENCTVVVDCQSEKMYPNMSGIAVVLHLGTKHYTGVTAADGAIRFTQVPITLLNDIRITVTPPSDPQRE
jgi:hypothetical protein